ncbi:hypothetical protein AHMF7605_14295 [Adhaeribacter arboris]|uniref:STAS/SEC14 domain-containing protein n=1 Tax=Adhaeribacter arboris TaxID=2072846 RepID=A0A2T2YGH0_9BACT|nr:hypothetical protein [Adhaeribacter arboris]PSR54592.1 hypothetical protein AHMF7605_14295 [Adhaeribacter arboris]
MTTNYSAVQEVSNLNHSSISANAILLVKAEESLIQLSWVKSPAPAELTECANLVSEIIKENNLLYFLHDIRNVNYTDINLQRCLTKEFCPQILEAGITRFVHLAKYALPEMMIIDQITDYLKSKVVTNKNVKLEICTTPEGASDWLSNSASQTADSSVKIQVKEVVAEQVSYNWAAAAQISASIKQYKEKASLVFGILTKRKSFLSDL